MQYQSRCNIFNSFGNALIFRYIYKRRLVKYQQIVHFYFLIKVCLMVFNTTFNNILLVEETGEHGESHRPV
jgi:hypothetical protein